MKTEDLIRELKNIEEKYKDEKLMTFEVSKSSMAHDCRKKIEELEQEKEELIKKIDDIYHILRSFRYSYGDTIPEDVVSDAAERLKSLI